jgi:YebC/PmpR family DNA-binding regulatory protein
MAGHSHSKNVKRTKDLESLKKSLLFSKMAKEISLSAKEKGGSLESNPVLKSLVEKARAMNVPQENIERAIKKGTGELKGEVLESFLIEAYGPGNVAFVIQGITDNRNRSLSEIKTILKQYQGKTVEPGAVRWLFNEQTWQPKYQAQVSSQDKAQCLALFQELDENDSVQKIYSNLEKNDNSGN